MADAPHSYEVSRILLIDDDVEACELLREYLSMHNFAVEFAHNAKDGLSALQNSEFDLVLLDIFLPDMNGIDVLRRIREKSAVPVVILSAHNEESDHVVALELGADDYIPKSFSSHKMLAHIRAVIRRAQEKSGAAATAPQQKEDKSSVALRELTLDSSSMQATLRGEPIDLTTSEFRLLHALVSDAGRVFSREELLEMLNGRCYNIYDRSIDVFISSLRQKLGDDPKRPQWIRTFRGAGYMIIK